MSQFKEERIDKTLKISTDLNHLDPIASEAFASQAKAWLLMDVESLVIDFQGVEKIHRNFFKSMIFLKNSLKDSEKNVFSVNLKPNLSQQIKSEGLDKTFNIMESLDKLRSQKPKEGQPSATKKGLNVDIINPFLTATQTTLEVQGSTKVNAQKPKLKTGPVADIAIAGVISLLSDDFKGSIVLCFSKDVFLKIYENMFEEKHEEINSEIEDAAGELLNIICGMAKVELNKQGYNFKEALPTVLTGAEIKVKQSGPEPAVIVPFESDVGSFHIEIEFNKNVEV